MAGVPGFEPGMTGSKPVALPLGYTPTFKTFNALFILEKVVPQPGFEPGA